MSCNFCAFCESTSVLPPCYVLTCATACVPGSCCQKTASSLPTSCLCNCANCCTSSVSLPTSPHPCLCTAGACLLYQLLYLVSVTPYFSPSLHVLRLVVRRSTPQELVCPETLLPAAVLMRVLYSAYRVMDVCGIARMSVAQCVLAA